MARRVKSIVLAGVLLAACAPRHSAPVAASELPPLPARVQHSGRLWIELGGHTADTQCARPAGKNRICFDAVHDSLAAAIAQTSWASFPDVALKRKGDELAPGDYVLLVELELHPLPPDALGPGWSAAGYAKWKLVRDGLPIADGRAASRSRADFAYGSALGVAAGEVVAAVSAHISSQLVEIAETKPRAPVPLPPVAQR